MSDDTLKVCSNVYDGTLKVYSSIYDGTLKMCPYVHNVTLKVPTLSSQWLQHKLSVYQICFILEGLYTPN